MGGNPGREQENKRPNFTPGDFSPFVNLRYASIYKGSK